MTRLLLSPLLMSSSADECTMRRPGCTSVHVCNNDKDGGLLRGGIAKSLRPSGSANSLSVAILLYLFFLFYLQSLSGTHVVLIPKYPQQSGDLDSSCDIQLIHLDKLMQRVKTELQQATVVVCSPSITKRQHQKKFYSVGETFSRHSRPKKKKIVLALQVLCNGSLPDSQVTQIPRI